MSEVIRPLRGWAVLALAALVSVAATGCLDSDVPGGEGTITTTTTRIASVNLVDPDRDTNQTCEETAPTDVDAPDPQRILVADPNLLDPLCALGLQTRVVASTTVGGSLPTFMGDAVHDLPTVGEKSRPNVAMAVASNPDIVLTTGGSPLDSAMGATPVVTINPAQEWEKRFLAVAEAVGRTGAAEQRLQSYVDGTKALGERLGARYTQASLVRFGADTETVEGTDGFAAQVLTDIGVQRPPGQREPKSQEITDKNFEIADGDVVYVSFQGKAGQEHGTSVLKSDRWLDMGAASWNRVLLVPDDVWYSAGGLSAANVIAGNVRNTLN